MTAEFWLGGPVRALVQKLLRDTQEHEALAMELLPQGALSGEFAGCFESCLMAFFRSLSQDTPYRYWSIDYFRLDDRNDRQDAVSLYGEAVWFEGGEACSVVRIDIGTKTEPLLYSFKFLDGYEGGQTLYIAKTPAGWVLHDA